MKIDENVILMWGGTNASIPSGWQRETDLDSKYPKSLTSADPGSTGGSNTHTHSDGGHTHTMNSHNHSYSLSKCSSYTGANTTTDPSYKFLAAEHAHPSANTSSTSGGSLQSTTVTWSSVNHEPSYRTVIFIKPSGTSASLEDGIITLYNNSSVPDNWHFCNGSNGTIDLRNRFIKGAGAGANANSAGGGTSHQHSVSHGHSSNSHTHTGTSAQNDTDWGGNTRQGWSHSPNDHAQHPHTHAVTLTSTTAGVSNYTKSDAGSGDTVLPEYKCIGAIQATSDASIIEKMVGLWLGTRATVPTGWDLCDGSNDTMDLRGKFIRVGSSLANNNDTGGSNTHNHSNISHSHNASSSHNHSGTHGNASTCWHSSSGSAGKVKCDHSHTVSSVSSVSATYSSTNITADSKSNQPAYTTAAYIQLNEIIVEGGAFLLNFV
jgi:hypothetical protein